MTQSHASNTLHRRLQPYDHIDTFLSLKDLEKPKGFPSPKKN
jgi:hypothetical protein